MTDPQRRWRLAFYGAVLVAVALAAALATVAWVRRSHHHPHAVMGLPGPRILASELEPAERAALRAAFRDRHPAMRERVEALRAARAGVVEALRAEPYDPARLEAAFAELRAQDAATAQGVHEALMELAASLDPAGRARLADAMTRRGPGERRGRHD